MRTALNELAENAAAEAVEGLVFQQAVDAAETRAQAREQGVEISEGVKYSERKHYDYSKPFAQQVEDLRNGNFPKYDALVIGRTPEILRKIGLSDLPMTINQSHVLGAINESRDTAHN